MLDGEEFEQHRWRVGVLAHAGRRRDLVEFLRANRARVAGWSFVATEETAGALRAAAGLRTVAVLADAWPEDRQLRERLVAGELDALIVLLSPPMRPGGGPDVMPLLHAADVHNVPVASNLATAYCLVMGLAPTDAAACARG
jgi:methylglyoxal synthase